MYLIKSIANKDATDLPLYIHCHGGGGYSGDPKYETTILSRLAVENKIACASIDYRLGPESQFPAGHKDAKT